MHGKTTVNRGDIWAVDLEPARGSEMDKIRPCLVVTNDTANRYSPVIAMVAVTTTAPSKPYPFIVEIPESANMPRRSWIDCVHIRAVDKSRLGKYYTSLDRVTMKRVDRALLIQLGIDTKGARE
jgi:mRNA interferase MazF